MLLKNAIILSEGITSSSAADGVSVSGSKVRLGHAAAGSGASDFTANRYLYLAEFSLQIGGTAGNDLFKFSGAGLATFTNDGLGATQVDTRGHLLQNNTAAAAGAQQYSPATIWAGKGWKTTAVAASQDVRFRAYTVPVQGIANPTGTWTLESSINGGAYASPLTYNSAGQMYIPTNLGVGISSGVLGTIHAKGSGATSATSSGYFTNSAGNVVLKVRDDGQVLNETGSFETLSGGTGFITAYLTIYNDSSRGLIAMKTTTNSLIFHKYIKVSGSKGSFNNQDASAEFQIGDVGTSSTRGTLLSKGTTASFAAIGSKATGLEYYSTDDAGKLWYDGTRIVGFRYNGTKFQGYDGASWVDLN